jgi:hypothetical protein
MAAMKHIADNHGHEAAESFHAELGYALKLDKARTQGAANGATKNA